MQEMLKMLCTTWTDIASMDESWRWNLPEAIVKVCNFSYCILMCFAEESDSQFECLDTLSFLF